VGGARGALTESAIAEHWRPIWWLGRSSAGARPYVESLVTDGTLERLAVEDGRAPVIVEASVELDRPRPTAATATTSCPSSGATGSSGAPRRTAGLERVVP
jgi:hypothetical protein